MPGPPAEVAVGALVLAVVSGPEATTILRKHDTDTELTRGLTDTDAGRIWLEAELVPSARAVVLAHELVHAMLDHAAHGLTAAQEEAVATVLGPRLVALVRDNPELIAYLRRPGR